MKIGVIGAGIMGHGITLVAASHGFLVVMHDVKEALVTGGMRRIEKFLEISIEKGKISEEEKLKILNRISPTIELEDIGDCDVVIEAIVEDAGAKKQVFKKLDGLCPEDTLFASNTSSISITGLASATGRPDRFVGMHFMNPAPIIKLVEVVKGLETSDETVERIKDIAERMDKVPVVVNDSPGFVSNRILVPMINEAIYCLEKGIGSKEAIDQIMELGMGHPIGPLKLADLIGLDICLNIMEILYNEFADPKYKPCPLLKELIDAGRLGKKTGKGFYEY